jgi:cruciform cutting endonuclease 1
MLYAILHTLKAQGTIDTSVMPIIPGKVTPFWLGTSFARSSKRRKTVEAQDGHMQKAKIKLRASTSPKLLNKQAKIDIVGTWLDGKSTAMIDLGPKEVQKTAAAFLEKWNRLPGRSKTKVILGTAKNKSLVKGLEDEKEEMGKLDDLADCLLQGMAWVKWEQNKKLVFEDGVEALDIG